MIHIKLEDPDDPDSFLMIGDYSSSNNLFDTRPLSIEVDVSGSSILLTNSEVDRVIVALIEYRMNCK